MEGYAVPAPYIFIPINHCKLQWGIEMYKVMKQYLHNKQVAPDLFLWLQTQYLEQDDTNG
jgi:hypothetical protein